MNVPRLSRAMLTLATLTVGSAACSKCKTSSEAPDAAPAVDAAIAAPVDAAPPEPDDAAPTPSATASHASAPSVGGPWMGTYACFDNMRVVQAGNHVTATLFPSSATSFSELSCTASGDDCKGTMQAISHPKGGARKVLESKAGSMRRAANGDITLSYAGVASTYCKKK